MATHRSAVRRITSLLAVLTLTAAAGSCLDPGDVDRAAPGPVRGGIVRIVGAADVGALDPAAATSPAAYLLLRVLTRQLVAYPPAFAAAEAGAADRVGQPVPDLAEAIGDPTSGGTVYTFRIRAGAAWSSSPPRPVVAADVVRGFQRLCNPVAAAAMPPYLPGLVRGLAEYCDGMATVPPEAAAIRRYLDTHPVAGVQAVDERTVRFTLTRPASDFMAMLAMPFAAPVPVEALAFLPDSTGFRRSMLSAGPYALRRYDPARGITLERNPAWQPAADPVRSDYADRIEVGFGLDAARVQRRLATGSADLAWDTEVPPAELARLRAAEDPRLSVTEGAGVRYLTMNLASPNENSAMTNPRVRQALNLAVDKRALATALGGVTFAPHDQMLPPAAPGHEEFNLYPTPARRGDPGAARQLLGDAGYPHGLTLTLATPEDAPGQRLAGLLRGQLAKAGIRVRTYAPAPDAPGRPGRSGQRTGSWDLALAELAEGWPGTAGRTLFAGMLGNAPGAAAGYPDSTVSRLVEQALEAPTPAAAAESWSKADRRTMQLAGCVPLVAGRTVRYASARLRGWAVNAAYPRGDLAQVWLAGGP